ncbi:hypothetical protein, partial [Vibrio splendidus]
MVNQYSQLWLSLLSALVDKANYFQLQNTSLALAMSRDDILTQSWTKVCQQLYYRGVDKCVD